MKSILIASVLLICGSAQAAFASKTTLLITGAEQQANGGAYDAGAVTVAVNGYSETFSYGRFSTAASLASGVAAKFSEDCNSPVIAHANGDLITFFTRNSSATVSLNASVAWDTGNFAVASFIPSIPSSSPTIACAPATVTSGSNVTCNVTLTAGASSLVTLIVNGTSGTWATAVPNSSGVAVSNAVLNEGSAGTYTIAYTYPGDGSIPAAAGTTTVTVAASGSGTNQGSTLYSYSIADPNQNSGYSPNGNIVNYQDSVNGSWSLGYDGLNRLISAAATVGGSAQYDCWAYDNFGNMLTQGISNEAFSSSTACSPQTGSTTLQNTYIYATNVNQITSGTWLDQNKNTHQGSPTYDAAGEMTSDLVNQYLYNAEGKVCAVQPVGGGTITGYLYDAEGSRVAKGTLPSFTCDASQLQVTENDFIGPDGGMMTAVDGSNNWVRTEISEAGEYLATYTPNGIHYQITDWLGTKRMQVNPNLASNYIVEDTCTSGAFGDQLICTTALDASQREFTGLERDGESNLDHADFRQFSSMLVRWTSPDPYDGSMDVSNPQSFNRYSYIGNMPLKYTDPSGLDPFLTIYAYAFAAGGEVDPIQDVIGGLLLAADVVGEDLLGGLFAHPELHDSLEQRPDANNNGRRCIANCGRQVASDTVSKGPGFIYGDPSPCLMENIAAVNSVSGMNLTPANVTFTQIYNGGLDVDFAVPGGSPSLLKAGRYGMSLLNSILGLGQSLHVPQVGGADPSVYGFSDGVFSFTSHIDSAYSTWHTPAGALKHALTDVRGNGAHRSLCGD